MVLSAGATFGLAAVAAAVIVAVIALGSLGIAFLIYKATTSQKARYYINNPYEGDVWTAAYLAVTSVADAAVVTVTAIVSTAMQIINNIFVFLPAIITAIVALPIALIVIEYHPEMAALAANAYQCVLVPILYTSVRLMDVINALRLAYDAIWGVIRIVDRFGRLLLRSIGFYILEMLGVRIFLIVIYVSSAVGQLGLALGTWVAAPGSVLRAPYDSAAAFQTLLKVFTIVRAALDIACGRIDFIWAILLDWLSIQATADLLSYVLAAAIELVFQIPLRCFTKQNLGTVPGVTADYGWYPNFDGVIDKLILAVEALGKIVNFEIYTLVREFVGLFDPSLFVVGSPEEIVLASDWVGAITSLLCAALEVVRLWVHWNTLVLTLLIQGLIFIITAIVSTGTFVDFGPPLYCDIREWRALVDYGGPVSLYFKNGSVYGQVYRAVDRLCLALDYASPVICQIIRPPLLIVLDFVNAFGVLPLVFVSPIFAPVLFYALPLFVPFALVRFVLHLVDSEWRMFMPPVPPRTGTPITYWIPAPALPHPPVACASNPGYPGYALPWLQHYIDDTDGFHLLFVSRFHLWGDNFEAIFLPIAPGVGDFFKGVFYMVSDTYDVIIQTLFFINVVLFEPTSNKALFFARWRLPMFLNSLDAFGAGLEGLLKSLDTLQCSDVNAYTRFFCCLSKLVHDLFSVVRELGYQLMLIVTTTIVPPLSAPDATAAIDKLEEAIRELFCVVSNLVIPFPLRTSPTLFTFQDAVRNLLDATAPGLVLIFRIANAFINLLAVQALTCSGGLNACVVGFGTFFTSFFTSILQDIKVALGDQLLVLGVAKFIDDVLMGGPPNTPFQDLAEAFVEILDALSQIVQAFAFKVLTAIFRVLATFIAMFFDGTSATFSTRITNFLNALWNLFLVIITAFPTFLISLVFGLIERLLPPPLNTIVSAVGKLLITGFCTVIQAFTDVVTDVLNAFGAGLDKPDFCCSGGSCVPSVKRSAKVYAYFDTNHDNAMAHVKTHLVTLLNQGGGKMRKADLAARFDRYQTVLERFQESHRTTAKRRAVEPVHVDVNATTSVDMNSIIGSYVSINASAVNALDDAGTYRMSIEDAIQLVSEMVEWNGGSLCDRLIHELNASGTKIVALPLLEKLTVGDCVSKRTLGEIFSIMPYMAWFPKDGFYNPMRWLELSMDGMYDYTIYTQYVSDRNMPRDVVLSDSYRAAWSAKNLRTDHLTASQYLTFMNWTYLDYVQRNGGNVHLVEAALGFFDAFNATMLDKAAYFDNMTEALHNSSSDPLEAWLSGALSDEHMLPSEVQQQHLIWTAFLSIVRLTTNFTSTMYTESVKRNLWTKTKTVAYEIPGIFTRAARWLMSGPDPVWSEAVKKRDAHLAESGIFNMTFSAANPVLRRAILGDSASEVTNPSIGLGSLIIESVKQWWERKREVVVKHLGTANSPRAQRNRRIIGHVVSELSSIWTTTRSPVQVVSVPPPPSIARTQAGHMAWSRRMAHVNTRLSVLSDRRAHPLWHTPARVATYATGNTVALNETVSVNELSICNASIVPFCLGCAVVDAIIAEGFISVEEAATYYEPGGYFQTEAVRRYNETRDYIAAGANQTICGGTGNSTIHWPSDLVILPDGRTLFDLLGGNGGVISLAASSILSIPSATVRWLLDSGVAHDEPLAGVTVKIIDGTRQFVDSIVPSNVRLQTVSLESVPLINITENRIFDYANSHTGFDLTYVVFDVLPMLRVLLLALDSVGQFITRASLTYTFVFDPLTNATTAVPVFDGSGESSVIGYLWTQFVAADYTYTCDRRAMTLLQGVVLTALVTIAFSIVVTLIVGMISDGLVSALLLLYVTALPYLFFIVVYKYPVQNLFFLPVPLTPMCFVDDVVDALVCDVLPKVPAVFAMAAKTPYTEANGYGCPLNNNTSLEWLHCKRDFGMIDAVDVLIVLVRWIVPSLLPTLESVVSIVPFVGSKIAARFAKFDALDLGDKATFDNLLYCLGVVGVTSLPTLTLIFVVFAAFGMAIVYLATALLVAWISAFVSVARFAYVIDMAVTAGTVNFVTPNEMLVLRDQVNRGLERDGEGEDDIAVSTLRRRRGRRASQPPPSDDIETGAPNPPSDKNAKRRIRRGRDESTTPFQDFVSNTQSRAQELWDRAGVSYFWQVSRGATPETLQKTARAQAHRLGILGALNYKAKIEREVAARQQRTMQAIFKDF